MLFLGIDLGTSLIKVSVVDGQSHQCVASAQYPETERSILAPQPGWAEQNPMQWWQDVQAAILKCHATGAYNPKEIAAIGIAYQMHGLVVVDKQGNPLRDAIIWCDSRAVDIGTRAFATIGQERCLQNLLNSPGNFTASKLAWVKEAEPTTYEQVHRVMLPGDFIAHCLTGDATTTSSALSEGVFWDFTTNALSVDVMRHFGFDESLIPTVRPLFSSHGQLLASVATALSLKPGIPVTYKAGDQLNNAFSLNVLQPGEVAATAGTSGVVYGVSNSLRYDPQSRINSFAHVNHQADAPRVGVLLCINGTGIFNRWVRDVFAGSDSYQQLNEAAAKVPAGAAGLMVLPFGNGAERMLNNATVGAHLHQLDFNLHSKAHLVRAAQEGIAFAFRYGLDIMRGNGLSPTIIRAGKANLFLSDVFAQAFVDATGVPVQLYQTDGSIGAALGAAVGAGFYQNEQEAFAERKPITTIAPKAQQRYNELYEIWNDLLQSRLTQLSTA